MGRTRRKFSLSALALRPGLVGLFVYLLVSLVYVQMDIVSKTQQLDNLAGQVEAQQAANQELQRTLDDGEDAIIERIARDEGYSKPNERIWRDISGK